jgi:hypothetical protein
MRSSSIGAAFEAGTIDNATITHAFAFLVGQRIAEQGPLSWDAVFATNPDLFDWPNSALTRMYPHGTLHAVAARQTFVMPFGDNHHTDQPGGTHE